MLTVQGWLADLGKWQPHNVADSTTKPQLLDDKSRLVRFLKGRHTDLVRGSASCNHTLTARVLTVTGSSPIKVPNKAWEPLPLLLRGKANLEQSSREQIASTGLFAEHLISVSRGCFQRFPWCVFKQRCFKKDSTRSKISRSTNSISWRMGGTCWDSWAATTRMQQICEGSFTNNYNASRWVALFSEDLIRIFHKRAKQDTVYINETGSVVLAVAIQRGGLGGPQFFAWPPVWPPQFFP